MKNKNNEYEYLNSDIYFLDNKQIKILKDKAKNNESGKYRICMHKSENDDIHEMIIVHMSKTYIRPHKHLTNFESLQFIDGSGTVVFFDNEGNIKNSFLAGSKNLKSIIYYKIPEDLYHMLIVNSKYLVFKETTKGPFIRSNTVFPKWAPDGRNNIENEKFISEIRNKLKK